MEMKWESKEISTESYLSGNHEDRVRYEPRLDRFAGDAWNYMRGLSVSDSGACISRIEYRSICSNLHTWRAPLVPSNVCRSARRSASTIMTTSSSNETFGSQPSVRLALDASPINRSTSVGR